jgi:MarR family transcriptional repressor of mepA
MHDSKPDYVFQFYIRSIGHNIKRLLDERLIPYDITNQQARIVGYISDNQESGNSINQKDIEMAMGLKGSSITSLMQSLERKGFILRSSSAMDARTKELSLTSKGQELINEFKEVFDETEGRITSHMTDEQRETFLQMLQLVNKNVEK